MRSTHLTRTLDYLNQFGSITTLDAFRDLGNTRLSSNISASLNIEPTLTNFSRASIFFAKTNF